ncbi:methyltransferase domain-containing protein [Candidatus Woesearchaeota archaeon]|nr:methyltransferase domain-containing protein [Candidatus Woesearchaeota archaeon]
MEGYYDSISEGYEELYREEQEKKMKIILSEVKVSPDETLLDVGCGTGITIVPWKCIRTGLDPARKLLEKAHDKENVKYVLGRAQDIPFDDDSFDIVTSITAIQNFEVLKKGLSEIKRVGKKRFVLSFLKRSEKKEMIEKFINDMFRVIKIIEEDKDLIFICEKQNI